MRKILIVEDELIMSTLFKSKFKKQIDIEITIVNTFIDGLAKIMNESFDLYILDYHLGSQGTGLDLLRLLQKEINISNRVIMISGGLSEDIVIQAYELGVSNFINKPPNFSILNAIIKKNLRMIENSHSSLITCGPLSLDLARKLCVLREEKGMNEINITPIELKILVRLATTPNVVISKDELSSLGADYVEPMSFKALEVHIVNLRKKSNIIKEMLLTKRGYGYYLSTR